MSERHIAWTVLFLCSVLLAGLSTGSGKESWMWNDPVSQWGKVTFSHRFHLEDVEAQCSDCHPKAPASVASSDFLLPTHEECGACHDVEAESECGVCHGEERAYEGFAAPERLILFNHQLHIEGQRLDCAYCHAGVQGSERPTTANFPHMSTCISCHNDVAASKACEVCHLEPEALKPSSHGEVDWLQEHKKIVRTRGPDEDCSLCHSENYCQACHTNPILQLTKDEPIRARPEYRPFPMSKWPLVLTNIHDLNYVFMHSLDSRTKRSDCYVCHDQQQFCANCHTRGQDAGFDEPIPSAHGGPDFVRIGVGSGGGRHADMARREIESCAACHDVEGRDAACVLCHVDRLPGRGNDPKTHPSDFRDDNGDWHANPGSVCFNCHTDSGQAGIGFCGYCHGMEN